MPTQTVIWVAFIISFFFPLFFLEESRLTLYCFRVCSGVLGGASPLPLQCHRLPPGCEGWRWLSGWRPCAGPGCTCSADDVPDAAEGGQGVHVDGGPHVGGGRLSLAGSPLHDDQHTFAIRRWLQTYCLEVNRPVTAEGVVDLQITGLGAIVSLFLLIRKLEQMHMTIHCRCTEMVTAPLVAAARGGKSTLTISLLLRIEPCPPHQGNAYLRKIAVCTS